MKRSAWLVLASALSAAADAGESFLDGEGRQSPAGRALVALAERVAGYHRPDPERDSW